MVFIPDPGFELLNGWLPLAAYLVVFGFLILIFPKEVVKRLYDRSLWSKKQKIITSIGKLFSLSNLILIILSPLRPGSAVFIAGITVFVLGVTGMCIALVNYRTTPLDVPVTKGIYRVSRNPQIFFIWTIFLGICLMIGSGISLIILTVSILFLHTSTLAEEKACLEQYGDSYRDFMKKVPRYFLFF